MSRKLLLVLLLPVLLVACDRVNYQTDANYSYLTINLTAQETRNILVGLLTGGDRPIMRTASVELRQGEVFVSGDVNDGRGGTVPGTLAARIWAENGRISAAVTQFSFGGFSADQALINRINTDIANGLAASSNRSSSDSDISSLSLSPNGLSFTIRTPIQR
jgi:hypothetical protein